MSAVVLRLCGPDDERDLAKLADLDSAAPLDGAVLAAEEEGELRAAISIATRHVVADPFRPTVHLVELLLARADQLADAPTAGTRLRSRLGAVTGALRSGRWATHG